MNYDIFNESPSSDERRGAYNGGDRNLPFLGSQVQGGRELICTIYRKYNQL